MRLRSLLLALLGVFLFEGFFGVATMRTLLADVR